MKMKASQDITIVLCSTYMESELEKNRFMSNYLLFSSDIVREQKSGSSSGSAFRVRVGSGINISGTSP